MPAAVQVGSKNAAFFMGKCIKIATRSAGSSFVHELGIAAADLEERYKAHEACPCLQQCQLIQTTACQSHLCWIAWMLSPVRLNCMWLLLPSERSNLMQL